MNTVTIHGQLVDRLGLIQQRSTTVHPGAWPQKVETRTRSMQLRPESFRQRQQPSRLWLDHDRGHYAGELVALEHDHSGLWATFVSDEIMLLSGRDPWYLSAEVRYREGEGADTTDIQLTGAALVSEPASTGIRPVTILAGDLTRVYHRSRWHLQGPAKDRIERAAEEQRHRKHDDPVMVRDHTPERERLLNVRDRGSIYRTLDEETERLRDDLRPSGKLRFRPSTILRVY